MHLRTLCTDSVYIYIYGNKTFANFNLSETSVAETYTVTCFTLDQNWETLVYQFPQLSWS